MKTKNIIFVHGVTSFGKSHIVLERNLTRQGYKFHSFDLPGHGSRTSE
jgi:alpha-beta hydrolase superfamily lysophospholipase